MAGNLKKGVFWLVAIVGAGAYFVGNKDKATTHEPQSSGFSQAAKAQTLLVSDNMPNSEQSFIQAVQAGHKNYDDASNDMQKGATRPRRAKEVCKALSSGLADNWFGTVYKLSSNGDGKGVLELQLASDVWIKTWNNSLSDISDHTLIDPDSSLFSNASALREGQSVRFSGTFVKDSTDCLREGSMSISGSMTEPEYIMRFSSISAG